MLAVGTGFTSMQGELIKSISYSPPVRFRLQQEIQIVFIILFIIWCSSLISTYDPLFTYYSPWNIIMNIITAVTVALPPEFPISLSIGIFLSLRWLKRRGIFWIDSSKLNIAGRVSIMVFDKTGTLTENTLNYDSSKISNGSNFCK